MMEKGAEAICALANGAFVRYRTIARLMGVDEGGFSSFFPDQAVMIAKDPKLALAEMRSADATATNE